MPIPKHNSIYDVLQAYDGIISHTPLHLHVPEDGREVLKEVLTDTPDTNALKRSLYNVGRPVRNNPDGSYSTHLMSTMESDGKYYMYPQLQFDYNGNEIDQTQEEAMQRAMQEGLIIPFSSEDDAHDASILYKEVLAPYFNTTENTDRAGRIANDKAAMLYDGLIRNGASPSQAAGLIGNADVETFGFHRPNSNNSFFHIEGGKYNQLQDWYKKHGYEPSLEHEGEFVLEYMNNPNLKTQWDDLSDEARKKLLEIKSTDNIDSAIKEVLHLEPKKKEETLKNIYTHYLNYSGKDARDDWNSSDPAKVARAVMAVFERPGTPHEDWRKDRAIEASNNPAITGKRFDKGGNLHNTSLFSRVSKEEQLAFLNDVLPQAMDQGIMLTAEDIEELYDNQYFPQKAQEEWEESYKNGGRLKRRYNSVSNDSPIRQTEQYNNVIPGLYYYGEGDELDGDRNETKEVQNDVYGGEIQPAIISLLKEGSYHQRIRKRDSNIKNDTDGDGNVSWQEELNAADRRFERKRPFIAYKMSQSEEDKDRLLKEINKNKNFKYIKNAFNSILGPGVMLPFNDRRRNIFFKALRNMDPPANKEKYNNQNFDGHTYNEIISNNVINTMQDWIDPDALNDLYKREEDRENIREDMFYDINNNKEFPASMFFLPYEEKQNLILNNQYATLVDTEKDPYNEFGAVRGIALNEDNEFVVKKPQLYELPAPNGRKTIEREKVVPIDIKTLEERMPVLSNYLNTKYFDRAGLGDVAKATRVYYIDKDTGNLYYRIWDYNDYKRKILKVIPVGRFVDETGYPLFVRSKIVSAQELKYDESDNSYYYGDQINIIDLANDNNTIRDELQKENYITIDENGKCKINEENDTTAVANKYNKSFHDKYGDYYYWTSKRQNRRTERFLKKMNK